MLATLLALNDASPVSDLSEVVGGGVNIYISRRIVDYLCGYDSDWWDKTPSMGALDLADKLGLERLLSAIARPAAKEEWLTGRQMHIKTYDT